MTPLHRILVVEDDELIRDSLVEFLDEQGYQAVGAVDGVDALQRLRSGEPYPCVIVLDLMMPNMDGKAFREAQLRDARLAGIPVIVVSAYRDVAKDAAALAVQDYLPKPLKLAVLLDLVGRYCPAG
jgi:CheY-like chemotaxis protein